jgi:hypothetical protein
MRNCATVAEQFANAISGIPLTSGANTLGDEAQLAFSPVTPQVRKPKSLTVEDGESEVLGSKRKRSARKPKDPNAPKRPPSNYLLFQNEVRAELKSKFPQLPNSELLQMISKRWAAMADADKEVSVSMHPPRCALTSLFHRCTVNRSRLRKRHTLRRKLHMMLLVVVLQGPRLSCLPPL